MTLRPDAAIFLRLSHERGFLISLDHESQVLECYPERSTPEDGIGTAPDVLQQRLHVLRRASPRVGMELEVPITPVDLPLPSLRGVAKPRDRELDPLDAAPIPRRARFKDRDVPVGDLALDPHLVQILRRHTILAPFADAEQV